METKKLPTNLELGKFYKPTKIRHIQSGGRASFSTLTITLDSLLFMEERVNGGWKCVMNNVEPTGNAMKPDLVTLVLTDDEIETLELQSNDLNNSLAEQKIAALIASTRDDIIPGLIQANPELAQLFGK